MTTSAKAAMLGFVSILAAGLMVHLFLPGGLPRALDRLTTPAPVTPPAAPAAAAAPAAGATDAQVQDAERAYDAGDFSRAVDLFVAARSDPKAVLHDRAVHGLHKAVIAWALTAHAPLPTPLPADPDGEVALRQAAVERNPSERGWYDLTIYAAGAGSIRKLPHLTQEALHCAQTGGPVTARLNEALASAGPRRAILREAMETERWIEPVDPVADDGAPRPLGKRPPVVASLPPAGNFKPETKLKLAQAVDLERRGKIEFDQTGPENTDRKAHRKAAYELLKQARDVYVAAQEEDPLSRELDRHIHAVMEMLSPLHKEMALGE